MRQPKLKLKEWWTGKRRKGRAAENNILGSPSFLLSLSLSLSLHAERAVSLMIDWMRFWFSSSSLVEYFIRTSGNNVTLYSPKSVQKFYQKSKTHSATPKKASSPTCWEANRWEFADKQNESASGDELLVSRRGREGIRCWAIPRPNPIYFTHAWSLSLALSEFLGQRNLTDLVNADDLSSNLKFKGIRRRLESWLPQNDDCGVGLHLALVLQSVSVATC